MELIDLTGRRFGKLTVLERAPDKVTPSGKKHPMWVCRCDCGNIKIADGGSLRRGETKTCGCWKKAKTVHGMPNEWEKLPKPVTIQDEVEAGKFYTINGRSLKLVGIFEAYGRFEDENGFHECYGWWDLERLLRR